MKRRLQAMAIFAAALLAVRLMAQDAGGGGGGGDASGGGGSDTSGAADTSGGGDSSGGMTGSGASSQDNSGSSTSGDQGAGNSGNSSGGGANSGNGSIETTPAGGTGDQGDTGIAPAAPGAGEIPNGGGGPEGGGSSILPSPPSTPVPGAITPVPGANAAPLTQGTSGFNPSPNSGGATQLPAAPITFSLPGGYGNSSGLSFTLGEGRLAKPPITFTATVSTGYDNNIFSADANPKATPTPTPGPTPPLEARLIGFRISPPTPPTPIYQFFRPKEIVPKVAKVQQLGVIASPVVTANVGIQIQKGTPRTVFTMDLSVGEDDYFNRPGNPTDYNGSFDLAMVHRISPRATLTLQSTAVYQDTPNFALINAPTNNGNGGNYLNGSVKGDLTYNWGSRLSTVTSAAINFNLLETNASNNLYQITYGTKFRYAVSARNSVDLELRQQQSVYPTNSSANGSSLYYLLGLDTIISSRLSNTLSAGLEVDSYSGGGSQQIPYLETATTLALPRGGAFSWTNEFGSQATGNAAQTSTSYRTGLSLTQPLSTKLVATISIAYNHLLEKDATQAAGNYTQDQFQSSLGLSFNVTPRLSLSLTYNLIDLLTNQLNSSYQRQQIYLGGTYTFK